MVQTWSNWKRFPDAQSGEHVEAPIGPGVYEVRHTMTGRVVAFGHSGNVANALADLKLNDGNTFTRLIRKQPLVSRVANPIKIWYRKDLRPAVFAGRFVLRVLACDFQSFVDFV